MAKFMGKKEARRVGATEVSLHGSLTESLGSIRVSYFILSQRCKLDLKVFIEAIFIEQDGRGCHFHTHK